MPMKKCIAFIMACIVVIWSTSYMPVNAEYKNVIDIGYYVDDVDTLFRSVSYLYYGHADKIIYLDDNTYPLSFNRLEEWPLDNVYSNYSIYEMFYPCYLHAMQTYDTVNNSMETRVIPMMMLYYTTEELKVYKRCKRIADKIKSVKPSATNETYMEMISEYLLNNTEYNVRKYNAYQLLFEGDGNCTAYSDVTDCIAKFLGIPCVQVDSDLRNHMWNMFRGSDGNLYFIDVTNGYKAESIYSYGKHYVEPEYLEAEIKLLEYEEGIMAQYNDIENKPTSYIFDNIKDTAEIKIKSTDTKKEDETIPIDSLPKNNGNEVLTQWESLVSELTEEEYGYVMMMLMFIVQYLLDKRKS